jgi:hypothetical protein
VCCFFGGFEFYTLNCAKWAEGSIQPATTPQQYLIFVSTAEPYGVNVRPRKSWLLNELILEERNLRWPRVVIDVEEGFPSEKTVEHTFF